MSNEYKEVASSFVDLLKTELDKVSAERGEKAAILSKNAFNTVQMFNLMTLLTTGHDDDDYEKRVEVVLNNVGEITSAMLADLASGLSEEDAVSSMAFADRMQAMQQSMIQSATSVKQ